MENIYKENDDNEKQMKENQTADRNSYDVFFKTDPESDILYDKQFITANFCPLKFSKNDIKSLSSDFPDQTLGGHRVYREELIDGKLAKVYEYKVRVVKYENEYSIVERDTSDEPIHPLIIVENNLIIPFNNSLMVHKKIGLSPAPATTPENKVRMQPAKRGRPRKYPVGKEPYRKVQNPERNYEIIPETAKRSYSRDRYEDQNTSPLPFVFPPKGYYDGYDKASLYQPKFYDFQKASETSNYDFKNDQSNLSEELDTLLQYKSKQHKNNSKKEDENRQNDMFPSEYF